MTRQGEIKGDNSINTTGRNWESFYSKVVASLRLISHIFWLLNYSVKYLNMTKAAILNIYRISLVIGI